jgi:hypothetical protein
VRVCDVFLDSKEGCYDAIYIHTENPHSEFPRIFNNLKIINALPNALVGLVDSSDYDIYGLLSLYSYIIQKKGVGLTVSKDCH